MLVLHTNKNGSTFLDVLKSALYDASEFKAATGYAAHGACEILELANRIPPVVVRVVVGKFRAEGANRFVLSALRNQWCKIFESNGGGVRAHGDFHSKLYAVVYADGRRRAWVGSSNFSRQGLRDVCEATVEVFGDVVDSVITEIDRLYDEAISIMVADIKIKEAPTTGTSAISGGRRDVRPFMTTYVVPEEPGEPTTGVVGFLLPLVDKSGNVPAGSGLNWQQKNLSGRRRPRPYEAEIRIPAKALNAVRETLGDDRSETRFIGLTPEGERIPLKLQGSRPSAERDYETAKQIVGDGDTTRIGRYIVGRKLGLGENKRVTTEDLKHYGRLDIGFFNIGTDIETKLPLIAIDF